MPMVEGSGICVCLVMAIEKNWCVDEELDKELDKELDNGTVKKTCVSLAQIVCGIPKSLHMSA